MRLEVKNELEALKDRLGGVVRAEDVLEFAKDETTACHSEFKWDNEEAGHMFRLQQARGLIRVWIVYEKRVDRPVRALISVPSDRVNGKGYRSTADVLDNAFYLSQVIEEALVKIEKQREQFVHLRALDPLFARINVVVAEFRKELTEKPAAG